MPRGRRERTPLIPQDGEIPIGVKIRARRWFCELSIAELAERAGNYRANTISQIETGGEKPSTELLTEISKVLGLKSVSELTEASREQVIHWISSKSPEVKRTPERAIRDARYVPIDEIEFTFGEPELPDLPPNLAFEDKYISWFRGVEVGRSQERIERRIYRYAISVPVSAYSKKMARFLLDLSAAGYKLVMEPSVSFEKSYSEHGGMKGMFPLATMYFFLEKMD